MTANAAKVENPSAWAGTSFRIISKVSTSTTDQMMSMHNKQVYVHHRSRSIFMSCNRFKSTSKSNTNDSVTWRCFEGDADWRWIKDKFRYLLDIWHVAFWWHRRHHLSRCLRRHSHRLHGSALPPYLQFDKESGWLGCVTLNYFYHTHIHTPSSPIDFIVAIYFLLASGCFCLGIARDSNISTSTPQHLNTHL